MGMWPGPWQTGMDSTPPTALTRLSSWVPITDALSTQRGLCWPQLFSARALVSVWPHQERPSFCHPLSSTR